MFPRLSALETFVADAKFAFREEKMSLNLFRNTLLSQQMILRSRAEETIGNNVSATVLSRLRAPLDLIGHFV